MTIAVRPVDGIQYQFDFNGPPVNGKSIRYNSGTNKFDQIDVVVPGDLTNYLYLPGRAGGQTAYGGTAASESLTLLSTQHATKGQVKFGTTAAWDETTGSWNVGTQTPDASVRCLIATGSDTYKGLVVRQNSASQSVNLFEVQDSSGNNYFETRSAASNGRSLVTVRSALTNTNFSALSLSHLTSGTPAASFGVNLVYTLQDDSGANQNSGLITSSWISPVSASRKARLSFFTYDAASSREGIRIDTDGSGAYVGINGVVDTVARLRVTGPCYITQSLGVGTAATAYDVAGTEYNAQMARTFTETTNAAIKTNLYTNTNWNHTEGGSVQQFVFSHQNILNVNNTTTTNNTGYFRCGHYETYLRSNSTATEVTGFRSTAGTYNGGSDSTGTITNCFGAYIAGIKTPSSTITTGYGVYVTTISATTAYGVNVSTVTGSGASAFGVYVGAVTGATNNYDLYCADTAALNYFAGTVGVGATPLTATRLYVFTGADATKGIVIRANSATQSANLLEVQDSGGTNVMYSLAPSGAESVQVRDSVTNALSNVSTFRHNSTGTVANNFGGRILLQAETSTTEDRNTAAIDWTWSDATDATRKGTCNIIVYDGNTSRTAFQGYSDLTTSRVGLCGGVSNSWNVFVNGSEAINLVDAGTTTQPTALLVAHNSSGTPAAGMGVQMALAAGTDTISSRTQLTINSQWVTVTDASRAARALFYVSDATSVRETIRLESDGSAGHLAFGGGVILSDAKSVFYTGSASFKGVVIQASSGSQTANLFETQNSSAAVMSSISPAGIQTMNLRDAATTTDTNALVIDHFSSGTPAAGYGTGIKFQLQSSTTASRDVARICGVWATATDASRKARVTMSVYDTATREALRFEASGSAAMIGFLGAAAVAQQNTTGTSTGFTAGAGTTVTDQSTFTGGTGATAYRISDVVLALKNYGLLAA